MRIRLICLIDLDRAALMPQFLDHYRGLGVQDLHIAVHFNTPDQMTTRAGELNDCIRTLQKHGATFEGSVCFPYDARIARTYMDHLIQDNRVDPNDWIVWTDSDEFQQHDQPLPERIAAWEAAGVDAVEGFFVDRVAADGTLTPFDPDQPLATQYPVNCNFTEAVLGAYVGKLVCARGWVRADDGNHRVAAGCRARLGTDLVPVHHYKWTAEALPRMQRRITPEWQRTKFWWRESQRGVDHIRTHGGIDLTAVDLLSPDGDLLRARHGTEVRSPARWRPHGDA